MYSKVNTLPVTGVGTAAGSAGVAIAADGILFWMFVVLASFALIGAIGAAVRTAPAVNFFNRTPSQLAPSDRPKRPRKPRRR